MAQRIVVYWRDIPAQIIVRAGRENAKRALPDRFVQAIDRCAMRIGATDTDSYLAEWRRGDPEACGDDLEAEADTCLAFLDRSYTGEKLNSLIANDGWSGDRVTQHVDGDGEP